MATNHLETMKRSFSIKNVRVLHDDHISDISTVHVNEDGKIASHGDGGEVIDGEGGVLLPGLIDAHVHVKSERDLHKFAQFGITTVLDMGSFSTEVMNGLRHRSGLPDVRSVGLSATSPGSFHSMVMPYPRSELLSDAEDASDWVQRRISEGSDYIKLLCDVPGPTQEVLNALSEAAHEQGMLVVAHAAKLEAFEIALNAGADIITHVPADIAVDETMIARMVAENRIAVPTLAMMEATSQPPGLSGLLKMIWNPLAFFSIARALLTSSRSRVARNYTSSKDSVTAMYQAGIPILAGTDANEVPGLPFMVEYGESLLRELELLVEAGVSTTDAVRAATSLPAKYFRLEDRGVIADGKRADLLLVSDDPFQDIQNLRNVKRVWFNGIECK